MNTSAIIQHQLSAGNWIEVTRVPSDSQNLIQGMRQAQSLYPNDRVRAVDEEGRVLDILT